MQWRRRVSTGCRFGSKSSEGVSDIALGLIAGRGTPGSPRSPGSLGSPFPFLLSFPFPFGSVFCILFPFGFAFPLPLPFPLPSPFPFIFSFFSFSFSLSFCVYFAFLLLRGTPGPRGRGDLWDPRFPSFLSLFVFYYTLSCVFSALPLGGSEHVGLVFLDFDLLPCLSDWALVNLDVKLVALPGRAVQLHGEGRL